MIKAENVTSPANPLLKQIRKAVQRGTLTSEGFCVAETFHLLEESLRSGCEIEAVLAAESAAVEVEQLLGRADLVRLIRLPDALFKTISATEASQGVMALVRPPSWSLDQLFRGYALVCVLDGIQDPGNAGSVVRAAEAFGATGILALKGTVSPYNPKAVRGSAGSVFRVPMVTGMEPSAALDAMMRNGLDIYATLAGADRQVAELDLTRPCAFIIGSEGRGVSQDLRHAGTGLRIPISNVESLNAAVAAGIVLYEARRQRLAAKAAGDL